MLNAGMCSGESPAQRVWSVVTSQDARASGPKEPDGATRALAPGPPVPPSRVLGAADAHLAGEPAAASGAHPMVGVEGRYVVEANGLESEEAA